MGKILVLVLICLAFAVQGCDALKNYYEPRPDEVAAAAIDQGPPQGSADVAEVATDYNVDETPCEDNQAVTISVTSKDDVVNGGWTSEVDEGKTFSVLAEKKGAFTTKMTITKASEKLAFTMKKVTDTGFNICDVIYEACIGECMGVKSLWTAIESGKLDIDQFNKEKDGKVLNAGGYKFVFGTSSQGDLGPTIEGTYFTDLLGTAYTK